MALRGKAGPSSGASRGSSARESREVNHGTPTTVAVKAPVLQAELDAVLRYLATVHELLEWAPAGLVPRSGLRSRPSD